MKKPAKRKPARPVMILERMRFNVEGKATSWEQSFDDGKTWEHVKHCYTVIPFVGVGGVRVVIAEREVYL